MFLFTIIRAINQTIIRTINRAMIRTIDWTINRTIYWTIKRNFPHELLISRIMSWTIYHPINRTLNRTMNRTSRIKNGLTELLFFYSMYRTLNIKYIEL